MLLGDPEHALAWVKAHCPPELASEAPSTAAGWLEFGERLASHHAFDEASRAHFRRIFGATFGANEYSAEDDDPLCECGNCAEPGPQCLYVGIPEYDRAFRTGFIIWCAENPEHLDSPVWLAELAYLRSEARSLGRAGRDQTREREAEEKEQANRVARSHNMPWSYH